MRVVFIASECEPWAKMGGLGDVVDALTRAVTAVGDPDASSYRVLQTQVWVGTGGVLGASLSGTGRVEEPVDVFLPRYRGAEVPAGARTTPLAVPDPLATDGTTEVSLVEFEARGCRVRMIDHPPAFDREGFYGDAEGDYADNGWRFGLLCRAALEALLDDDKPVDVLHLHDWQAAPAVILRDLAYAAYPRISNAGVMLTIHSFAYQGWLSREQLAGMAFPDEVVQLVGPGEGGLSLLRAGLERAELVNTVSPGYAREVLTPAQGMGLDRALSSLGHRFGGILHGLDSAAWDPSTDAALAANYSAADLTGKAACKRALLTELGLDPDAPGPVLGLVGWLGPYKGYDLLGEAAPELLAAGARIVGLGHGDAAHWGRLPEVAAKKPQEVALVNRFDRALARRIYAGADLFVMPSRFEPCGQGQMIALRYGSPVIAHRTGGLADTVVDTDERPDEGTGFLFAEPTKGALLKACRRALACYKRGGEKWAGLVDRGMAIDWSWEAGPAEQYAASYRRAVSIRREGPTDRRGSFWGRPADS
jgi:starch synthase